MSLRFRIRTDFPYKINTMEHIYIPLSDGTRLAAKMWLPDTGDRQSFPALLEYIPYRKRDVEAWQDSIAHPYFAGHGYASLRVDLRGSGDSEGVLKDEYLLQEQEDCLEVLRWIAEQKWCDGNIGMMGISWGGFNGLQVAARQPSELKTIITLCSTDDRYADDVHYMGGCLLGDNLSWASVMFAFNSCPPDPEIVGSSWRDMWFERMEKSGLWLETWLQHQTRDDYWKHGSVCENYGNIKIPVFAISGWADGYSNAVFRLMQHLDVPRKGLVGPWSHKYPHMGKPGPAIGFLQEAVRWWDHWLKGEDRGIMAEPMLRVWMQDTVPPSTGYRLRPGRWVAERKWPSADIVYTTFRLADNKMIAEGEMENRKGPPLTIQSPLSVGLYAGKWCSYSATPDLPHDQREDDGGALIFESRPLSEDLEIMGPPEVVLHFSANKPVAMTAIRLSDVAPDDKATRITYGILNLTHRNSHEHPEFLEPGKKYQVTVKLNDIAQRFPLGHRLRISLSSSYFPLAWPAPSPVRLTIFPETQVHIPVRPVKEEDKSLRPFEPPEGAEPLLVKQLTPSCHDWIVKRHLADDLSTLEVIKDEGIQRIEYSQTELEDTAHEWYSYQFDDFATVRGEVRSVRGFKRGNWQVRTNTRTVLLSSPTDFRIHAELEAYEGQFKVYSKIWDKKILRTFI